MPRISNARLMARFDAAEFAVSAELMHVTPVLSADSIFLYFATASRDEARARVDYYPTGAFRFYLSGVADNYNTNLNPALSTGAELASGRFAFPPSFAWGGSVGTLAKAGTLKASLDLTYKNGYGGRQAWVDLAGGWTPENGLFTVDARLSYANIHDPLNPLLQGGFFGAQLWGSWFLSRSTRASLVVEENVNAFTRSDTKVFLIFDWKITI